MLSELRHIKDIESSFTSFELSEIGSKERRKGGVRLDVLVSSGSPERETMMDDKSRQSKYGTSEKMRIGVSIWGSFQ
jgi:hypothetical protein